MRPGIFTPENASRMGQCAARYQGFNEAGDFHPRKLDLMAMTVSSSPASMRPGIFTPENLMEQPLAIAAWPSSFNEAGDFHPRKL